MPRLSFSARISLGSNALALLATGLAWWGWPARPPLPYDVHKLLHILGVVVFMGNLFVGPLWVALAWKDRAQLAFAARCLAAADVWLTAPGVQLAVWNGIGLAAALGGVQARPWLVESVLLLIGTSILSCTLVLYWQERFIAAAQAEDEPATRRALLHWGFWGSLVGLPFGLISWLMVSKQPLFLAG